jgi:hypothetical protein
MSILSYGGLLGLGSFMCRHGAISKETKTLGTVTRSRTDWRDASRQTDAQGSNWIISWAKSTTLSSALLFCLSSTHVSVHVSSTVNGRSAAQAVQLVWLVCSAWRTPHKRRDSYVIAISAFNRKINACPKRFSDYITYQIIERDNGNPAAIVHTLLFRTTRVPFVKGERYWNFSKKGDFLQFSSILLN